eukprot:TRINITY_DN5200_c0_g1_i1.p4 TRINITY_DN5200_c0_g1~~TRINITY_DN5200_c0_g1_i1.p4  ORF type:complete len:82 (-),score=21.45 TRINITY_DN5200_c0_g1_i1:194-439(-)
MHRRFSDDQDAAGSDTNSPRPDAVEGGLFSPRPGTQTKLTAEDFDKKDAKEDAAERADVAAMNAVNPDSIADMENKLYKEK